jgi:predicted transcriptional regulator
MPSEIDEIKNEIKKRRKLLNLSQQQLAQLSSVSQSAIAKIESKKIHYQSSYVNVKKILDALDKEEGKTTKKAKNIHNTTIIFASTTDTITKVAQTMKKHDYSQLPVRNTSNDIVGSISEETIRNYLAKGNNPEQLPTMQVDDLKAEAFPQVDENYPVNEILSLLRYSQAILTTRNGKVVGIITKTDLFKLIPR